jgi:pimeloyl-ACP methyl ester carboxylesterase
MSMIKILWAGGVTGAVLVGVSFGATWYAARTPACALARVLDGASHAAGRCQPAEGFAPLVQRLESARCTAAGEVDLVKGGLPDEPMADDPAPIVIPEVEAQPTQVLAFPADSATPAAAPAAGAPMMHYCTDDAPVLPMPRVLPAEEEQEEPCAADLRAMFEELVTRMREAETGSLLQGLGQPTPECREDPFRDHHHNGCPATGRGYNGFTLPYVPSPALEKARKLNEREPMERTGPTTGVDTMEYRLSDRPAKENGPGGQ